MPIFNSVYKSFTPWRKPWANTIVYIPMKEDLLSHTTNPITVTNNNSVSIVSSGVWASIPVGYFGWASRNLSFTNTSNMSGTWTIQAWIKLPLENRVAWVMAQWTPQWTKVIFYWYQASAARWLCVSNYSNDIDVGSTTWRDNSWHLITATYSGVANQSNNIKIYVDWTLVKQWTSDGFQTPDNTAYVGNYKLNDQFNGYMSEFILESKEWTLSEISDYFNGTKWNYWIS